MTFGTTINTVLATLGNLGSFNSGFVDVKGSKALMDYQTHHWRNNTQWYNENGYKFLRQGLINADYNPILAIGSSPLNGAMPTASGMANMSVDAASGMQASTARNISESQIQMNKASANKTAEEALTQQNIRNNLDSQSLLNLLSSERIQKLLPYDVQKSIAEIAVLESSQNLNNVTARYVPYNAISGRIQSNAAKTTAEFGKEWTPKAAMLGLGAGLLGLAPFGIGKIKSLLKRPVGFR